MLLRPGHFCRGRQNNRRPSSCRYSWEATKWMRRSAATSSLARLSTGTKASINGHTKARQLSPARGLYLRSRRGLPVKSKVTNWESIEGSRWFSQVWRKRTCAAQKRGRGKRNANRFCLGKSFVVSRLWSGRLRSVSNTLCIDRSVEEKENVRQLCGANLIGNETNPDGTIVISHRSIQKKET